MDQTINEMVYRGRINNTVRAWNDQTDGKNSTGGTIIASDGTSYKKVGNRLVQILDPKMKKLVDRLSVKLTNEGLVKSAKAEVSEKLSTEAELIAEL